MGLKNFRYYTQQQIDDFFNVYKDAAILISTMKKGVGNPPADGLEDGFPTLDFNDAVNKEVFILVHSPHEYKQGTDVNFHIEFLVDVVDAVVERNVCWATEYKVIQHGDVFSFVGGTATTFKSHPVPIITANKELQTCDHLTIPSAALVGEGLLIMRLYRDAVGALGVDDQVGDARIVYAHLHYITDRYGDPID